MQKRLEKGFTLIEILIVVGLIGALFLGILATVDPLEQLKKGADSSKRSLAVQIYNGMLQYYASQSQMPWGTTAVNSVVATAISMTAAATGHLTKVIAFGELKSDFINLAGNNLKKIFLTSTADVNGNIGAVASCFQPESKGFKKDNNTKYDVDSDIASGCISQGGTANCYWCMK